MKLVFHVSGKIPVESGKLNKYNKGEEITNLQFLRNMLGSKSGPGLEVELKELSDLNTSIRSMEQE